MGDEMTGNERESDETRNWEGTRVESHGHHDGEHETEDPLRTHTHTSNPNTCIKYIHTDPDDVCIWKREGEPDFGSMKWL